ncbi:copper resistance protein CopD [Caulobacter segnis]|uniref:Copper resistance D domain protein n=2 Tax=Caulobacter segnis TaxID=88688 RepID=D5VKE8_CAUST|nr:copper homeostasis membrane protein CopD [Caulobacter segnis]ADG10971.1 copper resistance D domain protein [Caulobacter segnis ATCC 21756]AVQ02664.1 copper resistance protein CopD [Caulobacter segnis]
METAVVLLRWMQYVTSFVLTGGALFVLYALPAAGASSAVALGWPRRLLAGSAALLVPASLLGLLLQTAVVAGSFAAALDPSTLVSMVTEMAMGAASLARALAAILALLVLVFVRPGRLVWIATAALGAVTAASMAWMGHGAATEGPGGGLHLAADLAHLAAAAVWIGALAFFLRLAADGGRDARKPSIFHAALAGFSSVGSGVVAVLVASGLINSWFLIGPAGVSALLSTPYGLLLVLKLALFGAMLALAAANRFRLTSALREALAEPTDTSAAVRALRRSLVLELGAAMMLVAVVAWLGRLAPISAQ